MIRMKLIFKILIIFTTLVIILLFSLPGLSTLVVNVKGGDILGRKIHLDNLDISYFRTAAAIDDLVIYEKNEVDTFIYLGHGYLNIDPWQLLSHTYSISSLELVDPYIKIIQDSLGFNFADLITDVEQDTSLVLPLEETGDDTADPISFFVGEISLINGEVAFSDLSLPEPFDYVLKDINILASDISDTTTGQPVALHINLNDQGRLISNLTLDLIQPENLSVSGNIESLNLTEFSPYSEYFFAHPIDRGVLNYNLQLFMTPDKLNNDNKVSIAGLEFGKKTDNPPIAKLPLKLGLYLLKDKEGNINMDIPVEGNPAEPEFELGPTILKTFSNLILKTATQPFSALAGLVNKSEEKLKSLDFQNLQDTLTVKQKSVLDDIAVIHKKKESLIFTFVQMVNRRIELQFMAVSDAMTVYRESGEFHVDDGDPDFRQYLIKNTEGTEENSTGELSVMLIGQDILSEKLDRIIENRNRIVAAYLQDEKQLPLTAFQVKTSTDPYDSEVLETPLFKIEISID